VPNCTNSFDSMVATFALEAVAIVGSIIYRAVAV